MTGERTGPHEIVAVLRTVLIGFAVIAVDGFELQSIGFIAPEIARDWRLPLAAFGPAFSAGLLGTIPGAVFANAIATRVGRPRALALALAIMAIGMAAGAIAANIEILMLVRFAGGIGMGAAYPLAMAIVADTIPSRRRSAAVAAVVAGQSIGSIAGAAVCSRLIPLFGWPSAFIFGGVGAVVLIPAVLTLSPRAETKAPSTNRGAGPKLLGERYRPTTLHVWGGAILSTILVYFIANWVPGILRSSGYSLQESLFAISLLNFGGIIGGLGIGVLSDKFGPFFTISAAYLLAATAFVLLSLGLGRHNVTFIVAFFTGLFAVGAVINIASTTVTLFPSSLRALSSGTSLGLGRTVAAAASVATGLILTAGFAQHRLFWVAGGVSVVAALNLLWLRRTQARQLAAPPTR